MLETYIKDHPERAAGIILVGSYLPDLFGDQSNQFPVPVLTAVGELDGMTISYVYRCNILSFIGPRKNKFNSNYLQRVDRVNDC